MIGASLLMGPAAIGAEFAHRRMGAGAVGAQPVLILVGTAAMRPLDLALQATLAS